MDAWYAERAGKALINHGASVGHFAIRRRVMGNDPSGTPVGRAASDAATDAEFRAILAQTNKGLSQGAVAATGASERGGRASTSPAHVMMASLSERAPCDPALQQREPSYAGPRARTKAEPIKAG